MLGRVGMGEHVLVGGRGEGGREWEYLVCRLANNNNDGYDL